MLYIRVSQPAHNQSIAMQNWRMGKNSNSRQVGNTYIALLVGYSYKDRRLACLEIRGMRRGRVLTEYSCTSKRCPAGMAVRILIQTLYQISDVL